MEIVRAKEAKSIEQGSVFTAQEYTTNAPDINIARITLRGRYPETGTMRNTAVKEIAYVEEGTGSVTIDGVRSELGKGDVVLYEKGEQVSWDGNLVLVIACAPAWHPAQFEFLPS